MQDCGNQTYTEHELEGENITINIIHLVISEDTKSNPMRM